MFEKQLELAAARNVSAQVARTKKNCPYLIVRGSGSDAHFCAAKKRGAREVVHVYWNFRNYQQEYIGLWDAGVMGEYIRFYSISRNIAQAMAEVFVFVQGE